MKKGKVKILIMSGYGLNCEEETKFAFMRAGGEADIVHINDLIAKPKMLANYNILAFPGGFSYGDDTGSGKAYANKVRNNLMKEIEAFVKRDKLVIGICNGFQIITSLGLLPGALSHNDSGKYIDRWVDLEVKGKSPWLIGIKKISLPIAHGEGRYVIQEDEYNKMEKNGQIAFAYESGEICKFQNLKANPNGSMHNIAGVVSENGRILGMMPHPERAIFTHHSPDWQYKKEKAKRDGVDLKEESDAIILFKNAIKYFKK